MPVPRRLLVILAGTAVLLSACGFGSGATREELVNRLLIQADVDEDQAECIAEALYDDSGLDEADIGQFTLSPVGEPDAEATPEEQDRYARYQEYVKAMDEAVRGCLSS